MGADDEVELLRRRGRPSSARGLWLYRSGIAPREGLYLSQLAWEFLRRNEEYRALVAPYVAAEPQRVVFGHDVTGSEDRFISFGLRYAVNPSTPGWAFPSMFWHPEKVMLWGRSPPTGMAKADVPSNQIFYLRPELPRNIQLLNFMEALDDLGVPEESPRHPVHFDLYRRYLMAYDLWLEHHDKRGDELSWREIGQKVEYPNRLDGAAQRARDWQARALELIEGDYLRTLLQGDISEQTGIKLASSAPYLGQYHGEKKCPFL